MPSLCLARHVACACGVAGCGFVSGCEHTSEDLGEELADLVFSCAAGAGRGEGVICTIPRIMRTAVQDVGFSGAVGAGRGEDALGSLVL